MKRYAAMLPALACALGLLTGCGGQTPVADAPSQAQTAQQEDTAWYALDENEGILTVRLPMGVATGYDWKMSASEEDMVEEFDHQFILDEQENGVWYSAYQASSGEAGKVTLNFSYAYDDALSEVRTLEVFINESGIISEITDHAIVDMQKVDIEPGLPSLAELRACNEIGQVLTDYNAASYTQTMADENGSPVFSGKAELIRHEGRLWYEEVTDEPSGAACAYVADDTPGAYYAIQGDNKQMILYPAAEYEDFISGLWLDGVLQGSDEEEKILNWETQDGMLILRTQTGTADSDTASETLYGVDPATGLIRSVYRTWQGGADKTIGTEQLVVTYGEPFLPETAAMLAVTGGDALCDLTLTVNPGAADEEVQQFRVAHDTNVAFEAKESYRLYSDAACTQELDEIDVSGETAAVYAVLE